MSASLRGRSSTSAASPTSTCIRPTEVNFKRGERAPLLPVGASEDHTVPASLTTAQYGKYEHSPARTGCLEFEGRLHRHMVADDWEEVAAEIAGWLDGALDAPVAATQMTSARPSTSLVGVARLGEAHRTRLLRVEVGDDGEDAAVVVG
jgi:hypothetical protein